MSDTMVRYRITVTWKTNDNKEHSRQDEKFFMKASGAKVSAYRTILAAYRNMAWPRSVNATVEQRNADGTFTTVYSWRDGKWH